MAQQKGQYQPGEYGLNAGDLPDPGITYANFTFNYNAGQLNFANGTPVKATGTYTVWAVSNIFFMFLNSRFWVQSVGSGHWGNNFGGAGTFYLTKDMGTTANFMGNWEFPRSKNDP